MKWGERVFLKLKWTVIVPQIDADQTLAIKFAAYEILQVWLKMSSYYNKRKSEGWSHLHMSGAG